MTPIDQTTLTTLFGALAPRLVLYARQWHDQATSEDLVQDVFVRLLEVDPAPSDPRAWLFRAVRNAAISGVRSRIRLRRRLRLRRTEPGWFDPAAPALVDAGRVEAAVEGLPGDQREVLVLRIWGGLTLEQVAEVTGRTVSSVFRRYRSGLAAVRHVLQESMEEPCTNPTRTTKS